MTDNIFKQKKKHLLRYRNLMSKVDRLEEKLDRIDFKKENISAATVSSMPKGSSGITLNDLLIQSDDVSDRINNLMEQAIKIRFELNDLIDNLDNSNQARVLDYYFIERKDLYTISELMHFSYRHVTNLYVEGVMRCDIQLVH